MDTANTPPFCFKATETTSNVFRDQLTPSLNHLLTLRIIIMAWSKMLLCYTEGSSRAHPNDSESSDAERQTRPREKEDPSGTVMQPRRKLQKMHPNGDDNEPHEYRGEAAPRSYGVKPWYAHVARNSGETCTGHGDTRPLLRKRETT